ncbi:S-layer protein [Candidatus Woesearchaeota archaeon]|nr:S-layer protein [Candidatus Woesearchaeota archaeon]
MRTFTNWKKAISLGVISFLMPFASAVKLSSFPEPFIVEGIPATNLAIVVGADSKGTDTAGAMDIIQYLQQSAVIEEELPTTQAKVRLTGAAVEFGTPTDLLEIDETLGAVRDTFTEADIGILKGGSISTQRGITKYNQYLQFPKQSTYTSNRVVFAEDQHQKVGDFLFFRSSHEIATWILQFEEGLVSDVESDGTLTNLDNRKLNILGTEFTIVDAKVKGNSTNPGRAEITFIGGQSYLALGEGDRYTASVNGKEHQIEIVIISETNNEVILKADGKVLPRMKIGEVEPLPDGTLIGVSDIVPTVKETQSSLVSIYAGVKKIRLLDNLWNDTIATKGGLEVNNEVIESNNALVIITPEGTQDSGAVLSRAKIERFAINITADGLIGDVYVPAGHTVSEYLDEPEALIVNSWDIRYEGLGETGTTTLKIQSRGRGKYLLRCVNQEGLEYAFPLATAEGGSGLFSGDFVSNENRELVWQECSNSVSDRNVAVRDFFIISNNDGSSQVRSSEGGSCQLSSCDDTAFSAVYEYSSYDPTSKVVKWKDLAAGTLQFVLSSTGANQGRPISHGTTIAVSGDESIADTNLSIDLDGDGVLCDNNRVSFYCEGGLIVNFCENTTSNGITGTANPLTGNDMTVSLQVCEDNFDTSPRSANTTINVNIKQASSGVISMPRTDITNVSLINLRDEPQIFQALTKYGQLIELYDSATSDIPEELTVIHPLSQRGAQVFLTGGAVEKTSTSTSKTQKIIELGAGVAKLDAEINDITRFNSIIIGGPCANSVAAKLLNNPESCIKDFERGLAKLKYFEHANGNTALLVAGFRGEDTRAAARALSSGKTKDITSQEAELTILGLDDIRIKAV